MIKNNKTKNIIDIQEGNKKEKSKGKKNVPDTKRTSDKVGGKKWAGNKVFKKGKKCWCFRVREKSSLSRQTVTTSTIF